MAFGLPGEKFTSRNRFARQLLAQDAAQPIESHGQGLAHLLRQGLAGYMAGQDVKDREDATKAMISGMMTSQWKNPDTGTTQVAGPAMVGTQETPQAGGIEGAISALSGVGGEHGASLVQSLMLQKMAQDQQAAQTASQRKHEMERLAEQRKHDAGLLGAANTRADTIRADTQGHAVNLENIRQAGKDTRTGRQKEAATLFPNDPVKQREWIDRVATTAKNVVNIGSQQNLAKGYRPLDPDDPSKGATFIKGGSQDPAQQGALKTAQAQAALDIKNKEAMPGRRADIITQINRLPSFSTAIDDVLNFSRGMLTSGVTGQIMGNLGGSDQYRLEKQLGQIRSIIGIDELVRRKESGATFGALSDTELALLTASEGALDGLLPPEDLEKALVNIRDLHLKNLEEKKLQFRELYPNVERTWEETIDTGGPRVDRPTEEDIQTTMQENGWTRQQVLDALRNQGRGQ